MEKEIIDYIKKENLENLEELFKILSEKTYTYRKEHNSLVPFNIFPSCLAMGGISSVVEVLIECYDSGKFLGYLLKKREKTESEWQGLYQIPGTIIRLGDSPKKIFERLNKEIWKEGVLENPTYFGTEVHNELTRKVIRTSMLYTLEVPIDEISKLSGEWKLFRGDESEIVSHHRDVINWKEKKVGLFTSLPESDAEFVNFNNKTILITGGLGFIGSNLTARLINLNPKKIILIDCLKSQLGGDLKNIPGLKSKGNIEFYEEDIKNITKIKPLVKEADIIFDLAGSVKHTGFGEEELKFDLEANFNSHIFFLESCRQVMIENPTKKLTIVFAGTRDQYGKVLKQDLPIKENFFVKSLTDYQSLDKNATENYYMTLNNVLREQGLDVKITSVRITNTYGPKQSTRGGSVIPVFIEKAMKGETIELWGGGEVLRDLNFIDDVVDAFLLLAGSEKTGGEFYNLGCCIGKTNFENGGIGGNLLTIKQLAETIVKIVGKGEIKIIPYPAERKVVEPGHFAADISKIAELGWKPKTTLEEGLRKTIEWNKLQG